MVCRLEGYFFNDLLTSSYARVVSACSWLLFPHVLSGTSALQFLLVKFIPLMLLLNGL